jgi:hypothetical protein
MMRQKLLANLAEAMEARAFAGRSVKLTPEIAALTARALRAYDLRLKEIGVMPRIVPISEMPPPQRLRRASISPQL